MRDVVYYVASSLDGFIAHEDGSFGGFPWDERYGADLFATFPETFPAHARPDREAPTDNQWFDAVLMGRKTYEVGLTEGITSPYPTLRQYVFSRTMERSPDENVVLVSEDPGDAVRALTREPGKAIWLCGGAELAATLFTAGLVDRLIVKLNPVVFGSGIPLFRGRVEQAPLELTDSKVYPSGHAVLHYVVKR
jgi:dihydrofolate reductase